MLTGCASNKITGEQEPLAAAKECMKQLPCSSSSLEEFVRDGHLYTTLSIADIAGYDEPRQFMLSYYSQYPDIDTDYEAVPVALKYILLPWKWEWRNDIVGALHTQHGGGRAVIDERKRNISQALSRTLIDPKIDWLSGLLIHAYADSYAHTKNALNSKEERAYSVWIGHALPSLFGEDPDSIKTETGEPKYLGYITDLYSILKLGTGNDQAFIRFKNLVDRLVCENGKCPNFHALYNNQSVGNARIDTFIQCMNKTSRQLSKEEIQKAIDLIKYNSDEEK
ncbi:MAG: hypothetical protein D3903_09860 [Candidatus Electrothrix sp. GM3_4]|nr:hypothetical protein [Candidatus Electrothrix sp. GM3_4]